MNRVVCDASPLIYLAKIDRLSLLKSLFNKIYIPEAVATEVTEPIPGKRFRAATAWQRVRIRDCIRQGWIIVVPSNTLPAGAFSGVPNTLDVGEVQAIALARVLRATLMIVDENKTIRFLDNHEFPPLPQDVNRYGIRTLNTLGVIHLGKKLKLIPSMRAIVKDLIVITKMGFKKDIVIQYLKEHGEWDDNSDTWSEFITLAPEDESARDRAHKFI